MVFLCVAPLRAGLIVVVCFALLLLRSSSRIGADALVLRPTTTSDASRTISSKTTTTKTNGDTTRSFFLRDTANISFVVAAATAAATTPFGASAAAAAAEDNDAYARTKTKRTNLSNEELKDIVTADMKERSFLVSADITRDVYDEGSVFTDEIDSYPMDKWIKGTKKLFVREGSTVNLDGDVSVFPDRVEFRFVEDLMFRIPLRPVVSLSGRVLLTRDADTGLITSYREYWDQDVATVLKTAKFNF